MTTKGIMLVAGYLAACTVFMWQYWGYLHKPSSGEWDRIHAYLDHPGRYTGEPVSFQPSWLKNYASDRARFRNLKVGPRGDAEVYWLLTTETVPPATAEVLLVRTFDRVTVLKLKRRTAMTEREARLSGKASCECACEKEPPEKVTKNKAQKRGKARQRRRRRHLRGQKGMGSGLRPEVVPR